MLFRSQKEEEIRLAEVHMEEFDSEEAQANLHHAQAQLRATLRVEELFWKQKARVRWNTKFFNIAVKQWRVQSIIHRIKNERREWVESEEAIGAEVVRFFEQLFRDPQSTPALDLFQHLPRLLTNGDNEALEQVPSSEKIRPVVFEMDRDSAAGLDGYMGRFFSMAWPIVGDDVSRAICSFFYGADLPRAITATSIVLIPKIAHPQNFSQFRPISLCNFVNKVLSRILADRLATVLSRLISP